MSLYDDATLICLAKGAAGKDGVVYNIKPEEKLKPTDLLANGGFDNTDDWALDPGGEVSISGGKLVFTNAVGNTYKRAKSAATVFEDGKKYKISFTVTDFVRSSTSIDLKVQEDDNKNIISVRDNGNYSVIYEGQATEEIQFKVVASTADTLSCKVDNVSVKEVEQEALDFTFTRGSNLTATRVGPGGLIEKGRENHLLYSNQLDTTWTVISASLTGGKSGYDGSSNAWELKATGNGSTHLARLNQTSLSVSGISTFSVYAKAGNVNWIRLNALTNGTNVNNYFDLSGNGAVGASPSNTVVESKIESVGSDWFRISVTSKGEASIYEVRIQVAEADGDEIPATNSYVFIQNAQLEAGLVATDYMYSGSTTGKAGILEDSPRFDYTGGGCPTWLGEPNRINLVPYSEYFTFEGRTTITYNHDKSPEGKDNSTRISNTTETGGHRTYTSTFDVTSGDTYTASIFAKKGTLKKMSIEVMASNEADIGFDEPIFNLDDGTIGGDSSNASMVDYGNGWYRCIVTSSPTSTPTDARLYIYLREDDDTKTYEGATSENIEIYGAQVEEGSYSTSYIPNYGASGGATRNVEQTDVSNLQSNGIITDTQGTFFIDVPDYSTTAVQWDLMSSNFYFALRAAFFANTMTVYKRVLNTQSNIRNINSSDVPSLATTKRRKLALSWNGTSLITSINGISFDDTIDSSIAPELDKIRRANWTSTKVSTDQILMFDKQLTKEELNELTSIS